MKINQLESTSQIANAFPTFLALRPALTDVDSFVQQVRVQQQQGYQIVGISEGDEVVACAGFRPMTTLAWGKIIYIDDLITQEKCRGKGYGKQLLDYVAQVAKESGCQQVHLDSGYTRHAAHRVYLQQKFTMCAHHFTLDV